MSGRDDGFFQVRIGLLRCLLVVFGYRPLCLLISVNYVSGFCSKKPKIKLCKCYGCNQCGRLWALDRNAERYEAHVRTQKNFLRRFPISYS